MGLEAMMSPGGLPLSPHRDLRYCYPEAIRVMIAHFNDHRWPELDKIVEEQGADFSACCDAMDALGKFLVSAHTSPDKSMEEALRDAGWFNCPPAAQFALCAMFGTVCLGQIWRAIGDTTLLGEEPRPSLRQMIEASEAAWQTMHRGRFAPCLQQSAAPASPDSEPSRGD